MCMQRKFIKMNLFVLNNKVMPNFLQILKDYVNISLYSSSFSAGCVSINLKYRKVDVTSDKKVKHLHTKIEVENTA